MASADDLGFGTPAPGGVLDLPEPIEPPVVPRTPDDDIFGPPSTQAVGAGLPSAANAAALGLQRGVAEPFDLLAKYSKNPVAQSLLDPLAKEQPNTRPGAPYIDPNSVFTPAAQAAGQVAPTIATMMIPGAGEAALGGFIGEAALRGPVQAEEMNAEIRAAKLAHPDDPHVQSLQEIDPAVAGVKEMLKTATFMKLAGVATKFAAPGIDKIANTALKYGAETGLQTGVNMAVGDALERVTDPNYKPPQNTAEALAQVPGALGFGTHGAFERLRSREAPTPYLPKIEEGRGLVPPPPPAETPIEAAAKVPTPLDVAPQNALLPGSTAANTAITDATKSANPQPVKPVAEGQPIPVPESTETLVAQQQQLINGQRPAQMFTPGETPLPLPPGMESVETPNGIYHFNPAKGVTADIVRQLDAAGRQNLLLNLGGQNKADIAATGQPGVVVKEVNPQGVEVRAAGASQDQAPATAQEMAGQMTPGNKIEIAAPHEVLQERQFNPKNMREAKAQDLIDALESGKLSPKVAKAVQKEMRRRLAEGPEPQEPAPQKPPQSREDRITMLQAELGEKNPGALDEIQRLAENKNWDEDRYLKEIEGALDKARVPEEPTPTEPKPNEQEGTVQKEDQPGDIVQPGERAGANPINQVRVEPGNANAKPGAQVDVRKRSVQRAKPEGRPVPGERKDRQQRAVGNAREQVRRKGQQRAGRKEQPVLSAAEEVLPRPGSLATPEGQAAVKAPREKGRAPKKTIEEHEEDLHDINPDRLEELQKQRGDNGWSDDLYERTLKGAIAKEAKKIVLPESQPTVAEVKAPVAKAAVVEKKPARERGGPRKGSLADEAKKPKAESPDLRREKFKNQLKVYDGQIAKHEKLAEAAKKAGDMTAESQHRNEVDEWKKAKAEYRDAKDPDKASRELKANRAETALKETEEDHSPHVQAQIDAYKAEFPDAPPIVTVHSDNLEHVVSPEVAEKMRQADLEGTPIRAFVDPETGRTILFHNRLGDVSPKEIRMILHEETIGHYGLEGSLRDPEDKDAFKREMDRAFNRMVAEGGPLAKDFRDRVGEYTMSHTAESAAAHDDVRRQVMAEVIAHHASKVVDKPWLTRAWQGLKRIFDKATLGKLDLSARDDYMQRLIDAGRRYNQERASEFGADNNYTPEQRNEIRFNRAKVNRSAQAADERIPFKRTPSTGINEVPPNTKGGPNTWAAESVLDHLQRRNVPSATHEGSAILDTDAFKAQQRAAYQAFSKAGRIIDESFAGDAAKGALSKDWASAGNGEHYTRYDPATNRWFKFNKPDFAGLHLASINGELGLQQGDFKQYAQGIRQWNEELGDDIRIHGLMKFGKDYVMVTSQPHIDSGFEAPERFTPTGDITPEYKEWTALMDQKIDEHFENLGFTRIGDNGSNGFTFLKHDQENPANSIVLADVKPRNVIIDKKGHPVLIDGALHKGEGKVLDHALQIHDEIQQGKRTPDDETIPAEELGPMDVPEEAYTEDTPTGDFVAGLKKRGMSSEEINELAQMIGHKGAQRGTSPSHDLGNIMREGGLESGGDMSQTSIARMRQAEAEAGSDQLRFNRAPVTPKEAAEIDKQDHTNYSNLDAKLAPRAIQRGPAEGTAQSAKDFLERSNAERDASSQGGPPGHGEGDALLQWAHQNKRILDIHVPTNQVGGNEHYAWFDEPTQRWIKITQPGQYGLKMRVRDLSHNRPENKFGLEDATPLDYIKRLDQMNALLGEGGGPTMHGVSLDPRTGEPRIVTSMPHYEGIEYPPMPGGTGDTRGTPSIEEYQHYNEEVDKLHQTLDRLMAEKGFVKITERTFYHPEHKLTLEDVRLPNVAITPDGKNIVPYDAIPSYGDAKVDAEVQRLLNHPDRQPNQEVALRFNRAPVEKAPLGESWMDPKGKFHAAPGGHEEAAEQIHRDLGLPVPEYTLNFNPSLYKNLFDKGWVRVAKYGNRVSVTDAGEGYFADPNGPIPKRRVKLTRDQKNSLEDQAAHHKLRVVDANVDRQIYQPTIHGVVEDDMRFNRAPVEKAHEKFVAMGKRVGRLFNEDAQRVYDALPSGLDARDTMAANGGRRAESMIAAHIAMNGGDKNRNGDKAVAEREAANVLLDTGFGDVTNAEDPERAYRNAVANLRSLNERITRGLNSPEPDVVDAMKRLQKPYADALEIAENDRDKALSWSGIGKQAYDAQHAELTGAGIDRAYREAYAKRVLEQSADERSAYALPGANGGAAAIDKGSGKARRFNNLVEAAEAGRKAAAMDLAGLVGAGQAGVTQAVSNEHLFDSFRNMDVPGGGRKVIEDARKVWNPLLNDGKGGFETKPPKGPYIQVRGPNGERLYVDKEFAPYFQNLFNASYVRQNALLSGILHTAADLKHGVLLFDTFHVGRVMARLANLLGQSRYGKGLANLDIPLEILNKLGITSTAKYGKGRTALDFRKEDLDAAEQLGWISKGDRKWAEDNQHLVQLAESSGYNLAGNLDNLYERSGHGLLNQVLHMIGNEHKEGGKVSVGAGIEAFNKWVFQKMTRNAMMIGWKEAFQRNQARFSDKTQAEIARITSKEMNEYFGNLGRQGVFKSATAQDVARMVFLAPQWANSMIASQVRGVGQLAQMAHPERRLGNVGGAMAAGYLGMFAANQFINMLTKHHPTWENEDGHKMQAFIPGGKNGFYLDPASLVAEELHTFMKYKEQGTDTSDAIARIGINKANPLVRAAMAAPPISRDSMGRPIKPGRRLETAARSLSPLPIFTGAATGDLINPEMSQKGDAVRQLFGMAGLKLERAQGPGQKLRAMYKQTSPDAFPKDEAPGDYAPLRAYVNNDHESKAKAEVLDLLRKGKTIDQIIRAFSSKPIGGSAQKQGLFLQRAGSKALDLLPKALEEDAKGQEKIGNLIQSIPDKDISAAIEAGQAALQ